jgi:acetylornithine aminotransferase
MVISFPSCLISGTTFGGNPLGSRLAHHVFQRISSPDMLAQIGSMSSIFQSHLLSLKEKFPQFVDSVRGKGLILGLELKSVGNKTPSDLTSLVVTKAREKGLLVITAGEGTIRLVPPLNIPNEAALPGLEILEDALRDVSKEV